MRGGYRPGTGGARLGAGPKPKQKPPPPDIVAAAVNEGMSPLEYMLVVMRDPTADDLRRDRMAQVAAQYVHAKPAAVAPKAADDKPPIEVDEWDRRLSPEAHPN